MKTQTIFWMILVVRHVDKQYQKAKILHCVLKPILHTQQHSKLFSNIIICFTFGNFFILKLDLDIMNQKNDSKES